MHTHTLWLYSLRCCQHRPGESSGERARGGFGIRGAFAALSAGGRSYPRALAEQARMSVGGIGALERGARKSPYRETLMLLAKALSLSPTATAELETAAARP